MVWVLVLSKFIELSWDVFISLEVNACTGGHLQATDDRFTHQGYNWFLQLPSGHYCTSPACTKQEANVAIGLPARSVPILIPRPSYAPARKGLVKWVALCCPHTANRVGPIRSQKRSHMTLLERERAYLNFGL